MGNCASKSDQKHTIIKLDSKLVENASSTISIESVYKFGKKIGSGTFGIVKKAANYHCPTETVAIKTLFKARIGTSAKRLKCEIDTLITLDHPNIIKCFETFEDNEHIHIVMEYLSGGQLMEVHPHLHSLEEDLVLQLARSMLKAVNYIHHIGIVHRDLKPENFLFSGSKAPEDLKLVDFGLSNKLSDKFQKMHSSVGTPFFIAPEVLGGSYDAKCDMWSIGVMFFMMFSGDVPFNAENVNEVFKKIQTGEYRMREAAWGKVTEESKHLVTSLLCLDVNDRLSASEALMHPAVFSIPRNLNGDLDIVEKLKKFANKSFLHQCAWTAIARYSEAQKTIEQKRVFTVFDRSLSGIIGPVEICDTLDDLRIEYFQHEIAGIMSKVGIRSDGKLHFTEFVGCLIAGKTIGDDILKLGFEFFDRDRKGCFDLQEFIDAAHILGKKIDHAKAHEDFLEVSVKGLIGLNEFRLLLNNF